MTRPSLCRLHGTLTLLTMLMLSPAGAPGAEVQWPEATPENKPWVRWWWPGSAVDRANLTSELESAAAAGFGGVEITPIYGARGAEDRFLEFLSPDYVAMLRFTGEEAQRLGIRVDMATGTGWPFGGGWITPEFADTRVRLRDGELVAEPTRMQVKRAAPGGAGLVVDPFSTHALELYLEPIGRALDELPRGLLRGQFHDSFEYSGDWSRELPEAFRRMHGYDIADYADALMSRTAADAEIASRVKSDYRQTLAQMHLDYVRYWSVWTHARGMLARNQAHGAPGNLLDLYAAADIPETEVFGSTPFPIPGLRREAGTYRTNLDLPEPLINRFASSAAHVMGRTLVSCETFTWLREHFKVALSQTKPELDQIFLEGVNHVVYHGMAYSPDEAEWPGWLFYASTQFNDRNTLWEHLPALNQYIQRVQSVLQAGRPDSDVLVYWPIWDIWADADGLAQKLTVHSVGWIMESPFGRLAEAMEARGYSFDYISDLQLQSTTTEAGELRTPGGRYRAIVVPQAGLIPVETFARLLELAEGGATVIFEAMPDDVPGLARLEERRGELRELAARLDWQDQPDGTARAALGTGAVIRGDVWKALTAAGATREPLADTGLGFIRRARDDGHHYFVANLTSSTVSQWVAPAVPLASAAVMNPLDGRIGRAPMRDGDAGREIYLQLHPGESIVLWTLTEGEVNADDWTWLEPAGEGTPLEGTWQLFFVAGGPELPDPVETDRLVSWTDLAGEAGRRFAGTARYRHEFDLAEAPSGYWMLDLSGVRESARVRVNGADVGICWSLPLQVDISGRLRQGRNVLEIDVVNSAANRIRDLDQRGVEWKIMHEINFVDINYRSFDAAGWALEPSGLTETPRLVPMRPVPGEPAVAAR